MTCKVGVCDRNDDGPQGYCSGHYQRVMLKWPEDKLNTPIRHRRTKAEMGEASRTRPSSGKSTRETVPVVYPEITPAPDQVVAIEKANIQSGFLCGDSMGVGKTVTGIGRDRYLRDHDSSLKERPTLIVAEKIGLDIWYWHLRAMGVPDNQILVINPRDRVPFETALSTVIKSGYRKGGRGKHPSILYFVCHWDVLILVEELTRRSASGLPRVEFAHVIADEVHLAKNRDAKRTKALKKIGAVYKTALSGTPADDKPQDMWSILNWLYPRIWRSYWGFVNHYVEQEVGYLGFRKLLGPKNQAELHEKIAPYYIRRRLTDINPDMPEKIVVRPPIYVDLPPKQRKAYDSMRDKAIAKIGDILESGRDYNLMANAIIAVLTRLQQMALAPLAPEWDVVDGEEMDWDEPRIVLAPPSPKLDAVMNMIQTNESESFVVFSQFKGMVNLIEESCQDKKISVVKVTGDLTNKDEITRRVERFQRGDARVFTGTIAKAGKGITLTAAHLMIFTDRAWNPSKNEQAEDRIWRRNQPESCRIYDIVARDTVDEWRMDRIAQKAKWIQDFLHPEVGTTRPTPDLVQMAIRDVLGMSDMT